MSDGLTAPLVKVAETSVPAAAAGLDATTDLDEAPFAATVTKVDFLPIAAITGAATNSRTVQLVNKGAAGAGTTVVASLGFVSGVNGSADVAKAITLSVVAGATTVAAGDVLEWQSVHVGTGLADPGGLVHVELSRS